ncbi:hypothetical protein ACOSQ3_030538 [Xanthoceras sorbifolium]
MEDGEYFEDGMAIGSFHAMKHGIPVVAAVVNNGPDPSTLGNTAPWLLTVGASTIDREFVSYVTLGNGKLLQGVSLSNVGFAPQKLYPLILAADARVPSASAEDASQCSRLNLLDPQKVKGKILVCIFNKEEKQKTETSSPQTATYADMSQVDGESLFVYINSTKNPVAHISEAMAEFKTKPAPMVADFSARGPCKTEPNIIKPDVIAPGVNIIAAHSDPRLPYTAVSGTSLSCPHVAGIVGLLKILHPRWTPSAIKSAIMTTATTKYANSHPILNGNNEEATPFDYGSEHLRPDLAADPGLVYDLSVDDYLNFLCARGYNEKTISLFYPRKPFVCPKSSSLADFNYPSIAVADLNDSVTITRRLKNVGKPGTYNASVEELTGISLRVEPKSLTFGKPRDEKTFNVV